MALLTTRDVRAVERFSFWVESVSANYFPIEAENLTLNPDGFSASLKSSAFGDVLAAHHLSTPYWLKRTKKAIAAREVGLLMLAINAGAGPVQQVFGDKTVVTEIGDGVIYDMDMEHSTRGACDGDGQTLLMPRSRLAPYFDWRPHGEETLLSPRLFRRDKGLSALVRAVTNVFFDTHSTTESEKEGMVQVLVHLMALSYGFPAEEDQEAVGQSLAEARIRQASAFIVNNVHDPRLNAELVAKHLGISVRRLYAICEPTGYSVAKRIMAARMERAKLMLLTRKDATILEIALACGFYSTSTFYRAFSELHGVSPNRFREQGGGR